MSKEKNKVDVREKPLIINGFKPVGGQNQIIPDPSKKGDYINEWQPVKYITYVSFEKFFPGFMDMGYKSFEVKDYGSFEDMKAEIDAIVFPVSQKDAKSAQDKITQDLLIKMQARIEELEGNQKAPKKDDTVIESLRAEYLDVIGEEPPKNMKNKAEWLQSKIDETKNK